MMNTRYSFLIRRTPGLVAGMKAGRALFPMKIGIKSASGLFGATAENVYYVN